MRAWTEKPRESYNKEVILQRRELMTGGLYSDGLKIIVKLNCGSTYHSPELLPSNFSTRNRGSVQE